MKVVMTGGCGYIGQMVARRILGRGELVGRSGGLEPVEKLVLFDVGEPAQGGLVDPRVEHVSGDIRDRDQVFALVAGGGTDVSVFHFAAVLAAVSEEDPGLAWQVNVEGTRHVLEACKASASCPRVVFPSSLVVFGARDLSRTAVTDTSRFSPRMSYGMTKAVCELMVTDYSRRGAIDGRVMRLSVTLARNKLVHGLKGFETLVRDRLLGEECVVSGDLDTHVNVAGYRTVAEAFIDLHDADPGLFDHERALNMPSLTITIGELIESVERVAGDRKLGEVVVRPDPKLTAIVKSVQPKEVTSELAARIGITPDPDLDSIVRAYIEDYAS